MSGKRYPDEEAEAEWLNKEGQFIINCNVIPSSPNLAAGFILFGMVSLLLGPEPLNLNITTGNRSEKVIREKGPKNLAGE